MWTQELCPSLICSVTASKILLRIAGRGLHLTSEQGWGVRWLSGTSGRVSAMGGRASGQAVSLSPIPPARSLGILGWLLRTSKSRAVRGGHFVDKWVVAGHPALAAFCEASNAGVPPISANGVVRPTLGAWASMTSWCSQRAQCRRLPQPAFVDTATTKAIHRHSSQVPKQPPMGTTEVSLPSVPVVGGQGVGDAFPELIMVQIP